MTLAEHVAQSEGLQAFSLALNVGQAIALAWIATRSSRVRQHDRENPP